jgi:threonine/homoserine/homoserine lactone efflux protein
VAGLITNLLNPKIAVFYLAALPQFVDPGQPVLAWSLALAGIHAVLGMAWLSTCAVATSRLRPVLARPKVGKALNVTSGAVLIGFAIRLLRSSPA